MKARVIYDFSAQGDGELSVACGEEVTIIDQSVGDGWWNAVNAFGRSGLVPSSFVEPFGLPEPAVPPPPPPTFVSQPPDWDEDWDSDDSAPGLEPAPRTPLEKTSNGGPHRPSNGPLPLDNTWKHSGSTGTVLPHSDSIRTAVIRKYFNRSHIRSGAEDFLLRLEPPPLPRTEAVIEYTNGMFIWQPASSVIQCRISSFHKDSKMKGMKSFIAYQLTSQLVPSHVNRRYKHFDWLHARLLSKYPCVCIPPLPEKAITGRYDDDFVDERRKGLQQWLDRMCRHPIISQCDVLRHFLSCTDEKRWKQGKREAETDRLQGLRYYYAVVSKEPLQKEDYCTTQAEGTEKFAVELERGVRALSDTINDFHRKLSTNTRKDFISLSGAFYGMCRALDGDTHSRHLNSHLYAVLSNVGETFKSISLCHAVESESFVQLNECLREYVRWLSTLSPVVSLGKSACLTADEVRRLLSEEKLSKQDAFNILSGSLVITRALQAECNFVVSQLRQELLERIKAYLTDRANFYRQLAAQLDSVASVF